MAWTKATKTAVINNCQSKVKLLQRFISVVNFQKRRFWIYYKIKNVLENYCKHLQKLVKFRVYSKPIGAEKDIVNLNSMLIIFKKSKIFLIKIIRNLIRIIKSWLQIFRWPQDGIQIFRMYCISVPLSSGCADFGSWILTFHDPPAPQDNKNGFSQQFRKLVSSTRK